MRKTSLFILFSVLLPGSSCSTTEDEPLRRPDLFGRTTLKLFVLDEEKGPVAFGVGELVAALNAGDILLERGGPYNPPLPMDAIVITTARSADAARTQVEQPPSEPGSFRIATTLLAGRRTFHVIGADAAGVMYGCMELTGQFLRSLERPVAQRVHDLAKSPFLERRALAMRLCLALPGESVWWFLDEGYWRSLLDQMARNRFNALDLRGVFHVPTGATVSAFPYLVVVPGYEHRGVPALEAERNLDMLNRICRMARDRAIDVTLVNECSEFALPDRQKEGPKLSPETVADYTSRGVSQLFERVPALSGIGFAAAESGFPGGFYKTAYLAGLETEGRQAGITVIPRPGGKDELNALGSAFPGRVLVEVELNGGHLGVPWPALSRSASAFRENPIAEYAAGPRPFGLSWRVGSGNHTLSFGADPEFVRRCIRELRRFGAGSLCLETPDAGATRLTSAAASGSGRWRHELFWPFGLVWGRLSFDPEVTRDELALPFRDRFGSEAGPKVEHAIAMASLIVPAIVRNARPIRERWTPELETAGTLEEASRSVPLDTLVQMGPREFAVGAALRVPSGRLAPTQAATDLLLLADRTERSFEEARPAVKRSEQEFARLAAEARCLASLGRHHARMLRAGTELALYEISADRARLAACREELGFAVEAWRTLALAGEQTFAALVDPRLPRSEPAGATSPDRSRWRDLLSNVERELEWLARVEARHAALFGAAVPARVVDTGRMLVEGKVRSPELRLEVKPVDEATREVTVIPVFTGTTDGLTVNLWHRALSSQSGFARTPLRREDRFGLTVPVDNAGAAFAVEVLRADGAGALAPDPGERTPYLLVPPRTGPAPKHEARLSPASFLAGTESARATSSCAILCAASRRSGMDEADWRRLLSEVESGLDLVVFLREGAGAQEVVERLPGGVKPVPARIDRLRFARGQPLLEGLPEEWVTGDLSAHELASGDEGWLRLSEPCCLALRQVGKGRIVLLQARLLELAGHPVAERLLRNLFAAFQVRGALAKSALVLDPGTDGLLPAVLDAFGVRWHGVADWR